MTLGEDAALEKTGHLLCQVTTENSFRFSFDFYNLLFFDPQKSYTMKIRTCCVLIFALFYQLGLSLAQENNPPDLWIGYNEHRTNLPGGRHANCSTNRAMIVKADGTQRRPVAAELVDQAGHGHSLPDGHRTAKRQL